MISFSNTNSEKNAVGKPQHQNVSLVFEETLKETVFVVRGSCISDHLSVQKRECAYLRYKDEQVRSSGWGGGERRQ